MYYLYGDLAAHVLKSDETPQELDIFYVRQGGLKHLLHNYYQLASLDSVEAGSNVHPLTLERLLPIKTLSQVTEESWKLIQDVRGDLKTYNDAQQAYGTPVPQEVQEVVTKGRQMLAKRTQRSRLDSRLVTCPFLLFVGGMLPQHIIRYSKQKQFDTFSMRYKIISELQSLCIICSAPMK